LVAINIYLDGSWNAPPPEAAPAFAPMRQPSLQTTLLDGLKREDTEMSNASTPGSAASTPPNPILKTMPSQRYIGSFGVVGWATKSGRGLLKHEEKVGIERTKPRDVPGKRRVINNKRENVVVRFTNQKGEEVGRLENEFAGWISTLIDQRVAFFEGSVVYAPDVLRTSETIYLQLRCYFLRSAFDKRKFAKPDNNRTVNLFEEKESQDEKDLRMRQVGLVKLFEAINLNPSRINATADEHKRKGLLQAAESAESKEQKAKSRNGSSTEPGSSPPSDDAEDGEELEQDQLDSLYKKAQSFDFNTPEMTPASTFAMDLRKYQKQALHWMVSKEKDDANQHKEVSMHPLWEEYAWPTQDANNEPVPIIDDQAMFYVNPYSGELSLEFPKQEQNCLGGILADGKLPLLPTSYYGAS
jgi:DNA repair protein RAD5